MVLRGKEAKSEIPCRVNEVPHVGELARTLQQCGDSKLTHNGGPPHSETIGTGNTVGIHVSLKNMEPVTTDPKGKNRSLAANTSALAQQKRSMEITEAYVTGFIDGEGSFLISFNRRPTLATGLEVRPSFSVSQHKRNVEILQKIQNFFGCGSIRFDGHDQTYKYEVRSLEDLWETIIPHFKRTPLQTSKAQDYERFFEVCSLMRINRHRSCDGIEEILSVAYAMNNYGARRYALPDLLQIVRKMNV